MKINKMNIVALRNLQGWSQEDLAAAADISVRTVQRVETEGKGGVDSIKAIAAAFDVKIDKIYEPDIPLGQLFKVMFKTLLPFLGWGVAIAAVIMFALHKEYIGETEAAFWGGWMGAVLAFTWLATTAWELFKIYGAYDFER